MRKSSSIMVFFAMIIISIVVQPAFAQVTILGKTDLGTFCGIPFGINDAGQIVGEEGGSCAMMPGSETSFLWENGALTSFPFDFPNIAVDINNLGQTVLNRPPSGLRVGGNPFVYDLETHERTDIGTLDGPQSYASAINNVGQVVGRSTISYYSTYSHAFLWDNGVSTDLGTLDGTQSDAYDVNIYGWVVGESTTPSGEYHAFLWKPESGMIDLGIDGTRSVASGINDNGQVVGWEITPSGNQAFLWENGMKTYLGTLDGINSMAYSINDYGHIVGGSTTSTGIYHAFIWEKGVMTDLEPDAPEYTSSFAYDINNLGQIVGEIVPDNPHATLWTVSIPQTPQEQTQEIISTVNEIVFSGDLNQGQGNALTSKLDAIAQNLDNKPNVAINQLNALIKEVDAYIKNGIISEMDGQILIGAAKDLIEQLKLITSVKVN